LFVGRGKVRGKENTYRKDSREGGKRCRCYKDEEVKLEEIATSHTLGG